MPRVAQALRGPQGPQTHPWDVEAGRRRRLLKNWTPVPPPETWQPRVKEEGAYYPPREWDEPGPLVPYYVAHMAANVQPDPSEVPR